MVQIVRRNDFVLDPLVIQLDRMLSVVAPEDEKIFNCELFGLTPSDFETSLVHFTLSLQ